VPVLLFPLPPRTPKKGYATPPCPLLPPPPPQRLHTEAVPYPLECTSLLVLTHIDEAILQPRIETAEQRSVAYVARGVVRII
jgi:hypothetical protein